MKELVLNKPSQRYIIRYEVGEEQAVIDSLIAMAQNRELPFDWFDAAVLSHQLSPEITKKLFAPATQLKRKG